VLAGTCQHQTTPDHIAPDLFTALPWILKQFGESQKC
jgi:hypothetical protein